MYMYVIMYVCIHTYIYVYTYSAPTILKYGSWSMAQGIKHCTSTASPKICGNAAGKDGAA